MGQDQELERVPITSASERLPVIILNPAGDRGRAARLRPLIERALVGRKGDLVLTGAPRDAERHAREAATLGRDVVAVGGDGTINEVATGILSVGAPITLGIVAAGSGNDYAYQTLRLPHEPLRALELALSGTPLDMDVGQVNGRFFLNSLGVGIDANIAAAAEALKRYPLMRGQTLYWAASLHELLLHYDRCPHLTVTRDGAQEAGRAFALAAVSIGPTYGGGFRINPDADPRDGYFDLCTIWKPHLLRALRLLPMVEKGRHVGQSEVSRQRVRHVVLESLEPVFAHLDGEVVRDHRFEAHVLPGALRVRQ